MAAWVEDRNVRDFIKVGSFDGILLRQEFSIPMKMHRSDAINLLAYFYLLNTTTAARFDILVDVLSENEDYENVKDPNSEVYNDNIRTYLRDELKGVANVFIAVELLQYTGKHIQINGKLNP